MTLQGSQTLQTPGNPQPQGALHCGGNAPIAQRSATCGENCCCLGRTPPGGYNSVRDVQIQRAEGSRQRAEKGGEPNSISRHFASRFAPRCVTVSRSEGSGMRILIASSEAVPFAKTGGLADVASALSKALKQAGHEVTLILPHYPRQMAKQSGLADSAYETGITVDVPIRSDWVSGRLWETRLPDSEVRVILVDCAEYFDREGLYGSEGRDYIDNCERFVFFSRAVLQAAKTAEPPARSRSRPRLANRPRSRGVADRGTRQIALGANGCGLHDSQHGVSRLVLAF